MKAVVAPFNQEKASVGAVSVITNLRMELFEALKLHRLLGLSHGFRGNLLRFYLLVRGKKSRKWPNLYRSPTFMCHSLTAALLSYLTNPIIKHVYFSDGYTISDVVMYWRDQPVVGVEVRWTDEGWQYGSQPPDHFHFRH